MYTIFTDIDVIDGSKDGHIDYTQFVQALKNTIGTETLKPAHFEYLSLKYRNL